MCAGKIDTIPSTVWEVLNSCKGEEGQGMCVSESETKTEIYIYIDRERGMMRSSKRSENGCNHKDRINVIHFDYE
jgi:hypothetical protein